MKSVHLFVIFLLSALVSTACSSSRNAASSSSQPFTPSETIVEASHTVPALTPDQRLQELRNSLEAEAGTVTERAINDYLLALELYLVEDYRGALTALSRSLNAVETAEAHVLIGTVHISMGNQARATEHLNRARELNPAALRAPLPELQEWLSRRN